MEVRGQRVNVLASDHHPPASFLFFYPCSFPPNQECSLVCKRQRQSHPQWPINIVMWLGALNLESSSTTQKLGDVGKI